MKRRCRPGQFQHRERGATAVEYALVVGLIGIGIITAVSTLRQRTDDTLKRAAASMHGGLIKSPGTVRAGQTFSVTISKSESTSVNSWVGLYRRSANIKAGCRSASECFAWNYLNDTGPDNYSAPGSATVPAQAFIDANGEFTVTLTAPDGSIGGFPLGEYELRTYLHGTDYSFPQAVSPLQIVP